MITYKVDTPDNFSDSELNQFLVLLRQQGEVANPNIKNIQNCSYLALCFSEELIGIGAIKNVYKLPFYKAKVSHLQYEFESEMGYFFVLPYNEGKGIATKLAKLLLDEVRNKNIFATTKLLETNPMKRILEKCGFTLVGESYKSTMSDNQLIGLFIKYKP